MTKPTDTVAVVRAVVEADRNALYHTMDGYDWIYEPHLPVTKTDVVRPGFFNTNREVLRVGAVIECRLGKIEDGITQLWLQVIEAPRNETEGDVMVAVGPARKFTPCRHDGSLGETNEKDAA